MSTPGNLNYRAFLRALVIAGLADSVGPEIPTPVKVIICEDASVPAVNRFACDETRSSTFVFSAGDTFEYDRVAMRWRRTGP